MKTIFDKISLNQLYTLFHLIGEGKHADEAYVKQNYLDRAINFDDALRFLTELQIVKRVSKNLKLNKNFSEINLQEDFRETMIQQLFKQNSEVLIEVDNFLGSFQNLNSRFIFEPSTSDKIRFSSIRNLFLELGFIDISSDKSYYQISNKYKNLILEHLGRKKISIEQFEKNNAANAEIGLAAELAIIQYELKRLDNIPTSIEEIEHTSSLNVLAGYDIRSFENYPDEKGNKIFRFIEVKAVSNIDFKFYWSRNEIEKSKALGESYFLYLLPVLSNSLFNIAELLIIKDPYSSIYSNSYEWNKSNEVVAFSKVL